MSLVNAIASAVESRLTRLRHHVAGLSSYAVFVRALWRSHRRWTAVGLTAAVVSGLLPNLMIVASGFLVGSLPGAVQNGLDSAAGHRALLGLVLVAAALVATAVVAGVFRLAIHQLSAWYVPYVEDLLAGASLRPDRIDHLENSQIASRLGAAAEASRENIHLDGVDYFLNIINVRTAGVVSAVLLVAFHWWAPLVIIAALAVLSWTYRRWTDVGLADLFTLTGADRRRAEYLRALAVEPAAAKELRVFRLGGWLIDRYANTWRLAMQAAWQARRGALWPLAAGMLALLGASGLVVGVLAAEAYQGSVSLGQITVFVQLIGAVVQSLGMLGGLSWVVSRAARTIQQIEQLASELPTGEVAASAAQSSVASTAPLLQEDRVDEGSRSGPSAVSLSDVWFGYPNQTEPTLRGLNLTIPAGQSIAIVGENGAGKSTLIKLICGLYVPDHGHITVDGRMPMGAELAAVRRRIAVIFQDFVRYELPLRDNVGFGNLARLTDRDALARAMSSAGGTALADTVGWDTVLSAAYAGGTDLSGGQWQKVALARALTALAGGAGLLILDEPTAALDVRAEVELFDRFLSVTRGTTTILISHRLSSVRHADRIVVLADGGIVEDGSHADLLASGGRYARMFSLQAQRFTADA